MTNEEAIRTLESMKSEMPLIFAYGRKEALDMAISALERKIPMKPGYTKLKYLCNGEEIEINHPECPQCRKYGLLLWDAAIPVGDKYCKRCGQAIDWTEGEGEG